MYPILPAVRLRSVGGALAGLFFAGYRGSILGRPHSSASTQTRFSGRPARRGFARPVVVVQHGLDRSSACDTHTGKNWLRTVPLRSSVMSPANFVA